MNMYLKIFVDQLNKEMKAVDGFICSEKWLGGARWIASWAVACAEGLEKRVGDCDNCRHKEGKDDFNPLCRSCVRNPDLPDEYERVEDD